MNTHGKRWLVIAIFKQQKSEKHGDWTTSWNEVAFKIGCVRAESEPQAFEAGRELLGHEITRAIPLEKIDGGWKFRNE